MTDKDTDEAAFPVGLPNVGRGMTLRDYFAAQALAECFRLALSQGPEHIDDYCNRSAGWAYRLADAMLKERSK